MPSAMKKGNGSISIVFGVTRPGNRTHNLPVSGCMFIQLKRFINGIKQNALSSLEEFAA